MAINKKIGSTFAEAEITARAIRRKVKQKIDIAIVLGSGFADSTQAVKNPIVIPYETLPNLVSPGVKGHSGAFISGTIGSLRVLMLSGRFHLYEGYLPSQIAFLILVCHALGIKKMLLTNAAGSLNSQIPPSSLCLISDHLNFPGFIGFSPLSSIADFPQEKRFLDCSDLYTGEMFKKALIVSHKLKLGFHKAIYAYVAGPQFETPAEGNLFRKIGADLCGMSTVPEALVAHALGMDVCALSGVTNFISSKKNIPVLTAKGLKQTPQPKVAHDEVIAMGKIISKQFCLWLEHFCTS